MFIKLFFGLYMFFSVSTHIFAQTENGKYDSIRIKLNTFVSTPNIFRTVINAITLYHQSHPELFNDYNCIKNSIPKIQIDVYWDYWNVENTKDITRDEKFDKAAKGIINKGGIRCVSIEYEMVPDTIKGFKIVKSEVVYP